jgi:cardiolipin synthase
MARPISTSHSVGGNRVTLYHDGAACLAALLEAIRSAHTEILLEMYWFGSDATGMRFADALREQAEKGVRVGIAYDAVGSWETDRRMFDALRTAGCDVREYNPLRPFRWRWPWRVGNRRNHRKLLIVDGQLGMTGGVNLADPWAPVAQGGGGFRDNLIKVEGPAVTQMRAIFASTWRSALPHMPPPAAVGSTAVRVLANDRRKNRRRIERAYLHAIRHARRHVLIENSYFIPSWLVRHALAKAVKRGVDVRILLPQVSDVPAVTFATRRSYQRLLERGVRLYEWGESVLHSKIAVVDHWCTVGTHNLDYRSWLFNLEINVVIDDRIVADELAARIELAIASSTQVDARIWALRPLLQRLLEELFYRFRRLL